MEVTNIILGDFLESSSSSEEDKYSLYRVSFFLRATGKLKKKTYNLEKSMKSLFE